MGQVNNMNYPMGTQMIPYQQNCQDNRSVGSVSLPPYPNSINVPTPPPPPPPQSSNQYSSGFGAINSNSGEVGQHFGGHNGYFA